MATNFPTEKDEFVNPNPTDPMSGPSHADQHANANDAIEALQMVVGITNSTDPNSLTNKVNELSAAVSGISNNTTTISDLLGLEGNNDLTVTGIENKTTVDTVDSSLFSTIKYEIQITRGSSKYSSTILVLVDGQDIGISESNIISNTAAELATITFEENSGIIGLCVTPTGSAVTVRYIRTALKA